MKARGEILSKEIWGPLESSRTRVDHVLRDLTISSEKSKMFCTIFTIFTNFVENRENRATKIVKIEKLAKEYQRVGIDATHYPFSLAMGVAIHKK